MGIVTEPSPTVPSTELTSSLITSYREIDSQIRDLETLRSAVRRAIEAEMGDAEIGTVDGVEAVRWTTVVSRRLSQAHVVKKFGDDELSDCWLQSASRRFTVTRGDS